MVLVMVTDNDIQILAESIGTLFAPERIILFGSHAENAAGEWSDVDLLIVMEYRGRAIDRAHEIWAAVRPQFPVDLVIRRPHDLLQRYEQFDPLARHALDRGKVLYERDRAGVALRRPTI